MIRWTVLLAAALLLAGCATDYRGYDRGYGYRYVDDGYVAGDRYYDDRYYSDRHYDGGRYYAGRGDYYYGAPSRSYIYPSWVDYPYYYSLFWPLQRGFHDPYWNPGFYYGVTYFPRNYFSFSLYGSHRSRYGFGAYSSFAYSPYRLAWVDHYYDWYPHYRYYPRHVSGQYAPRFGNARHEAERLSHWQRATPRHGGYASGLPVDRGGSHALRNPDRDADYGSRTAARVDPGVRGFNRDAGLGGANLQRGELTRRGDVLGAGSERPFNRDAQARSGSVRAEAFERGERGPQARVDGERRSVAREWNRDAQARGADMRSDRTERGERGFARDARSADYARVERERAGYGRADAARADGFRDVAPQRAETARPAGFRDVAPRAEAGADRGWQRVERGSYARSQAVQPISRSNRVAVDAYERRDAALDARSYRNADRDGYRLDAAPRDGYRVDARPSRAESWGGQARAVAPAAPQWQAEPRSFQRPEPRGEVYIGGGDVRGGGYAAPAAAPRFEAPPPRAEIAVREAPRFEAGDSRPAPRSEARGEGRRGRGASYDPQ